MAAHFKSDQELLSNFNLVSASKLTKQSRSCLTVLDDCCLIQEMHGCKMIGIAKEINDLYYLMISCQDGKHVSEKGDNSFHAFTCNAIKLQVWHYRLGHLVVNKLHHIECLGLNN
ncbi:unnamed protein product [Cuscuta epithymum]|uniref:GAG-pre-integrase domain-containing protein n=1 Tax=Cuscuta epithymum TaxID=186058 RepID=A0AAV0FJM8_9ASTE|nr:unnamed protein product [Cuscuta epithymum]